MAAANKTRRTGASTAAFIAALTDKTRREDGRALTRLMRRATGASPAMWGPSIIGFGRIRYTYRSGRSGEWFKLGFSPRKQGLTLYIMPTLKGLGPLLKALGPHRTGACCVYLSSLDAVDQEALARLLIAAVKQAPVAYAAVGATVAPGPSPRSRSRAKKHPAQRAG